jgi:hypothetical protein
MSLPRVKNLRKAASPDKKTKPAQGQPKIGSKTVTNETYEPF